MKIKIANKKQENLFLENFKSGLEYIKESSKFIYIVSAIFLFFIFIGYFVQAPDFIVKIILEFIEELLNRTENMSWVELTGFIFFNNLQSSFFGMIFGFLFGILSVITVVVNGYLLGFVSAQVVETEGIIALWRLFPHGIFELPAILISMGLGLRIGTFIFYKKKVKSLKKLLLKSMKTFFFIVIPLLIVAALIESTLIFLGV